MKTCNKCGETKAVAMFHKNKQSKDGRHGSCKKCIAAYHKQRYEAQKVPKKPAKRGPRKKDMVNSPPHYKTGGLECIDAMVQVFGAEAVRTYARINAFKYQWRAPYKGKQAEDLAKALWYLRFANGDDPRKEAA
tara:strand:- start:3002 stop:3403 length:402 start_codon:yes stop_codon:yes gene_type:complete